MRFRSRRSRTAHPSRLARASAEARMERMGRANARSRFKFLVIPGCATWRRPGIHTLGRGYGFRARVFDAPRNDGLDFRQAFPTPSLGERFINGSGALPGEVANARLKLFWLFESFGPSCPDLIRASIHFRNKFFRRWITGSSPVMTISKGPISAAASAPPN